METKDVLVEKEFEGLRLDLFLARRGLVSSRSQARLMLKEGRIQLNQTNPRASTRLRSKDRIKISLPKKPSVIGLVPYNSPPEIVFEDKWILLVNKKAGMVVHPSIGHEEKTLVNVLFHQKRLSPGLQAFRPGVVHRLDKDVSGLLLLSKTQTAEDRLIRQFKQREIKREYWAVCLCPPSAEEGWIESRISRHPIHRQKFTSLSLSQPKGKAALTFYRLIRKHQSGLSWIKCRLLTGRTHQIRVHLSSIACPLVGDKVYGPHYGPPSSSSSRRRFDFLKNQPQSLKAQVQNLNRIALHAQSLEFFHPLLGKKMFFHSPWPKDLNPLLKVLGFL